MHPTREGRRALRPRGRGGALEVGAAVGDALDGQGAHAHLVAGEGAGLVGEHVAHAPQVLDDVAVARLGPLVRPLCPHLGVVVDEVALQRGISGFDPGQAAFGPRQLSRLLVTASICVRGRGEELGWSDECGQHGIGCPPGMHSIPSSRQQQKM